jgi:acetyl-CoA acetyltransferase
MPDAKVYIAGVGVTNSQSNNGAEQKDLVSAATKALIDAGITYDDIDTSLAAKSRQDTAQVFRAFDDREQKGKIRQAQASNLFGDAIELAGSGRARCVLAVGVQKVRWPFMLIRDEGHIDFELAVSRDRVDTCVGEDAVAASVLEGFVCARTEVD